MRISHYFILFLLMFVTKHVYPQALPTTMSNYMTVNAAKFNPAHLADPINFFDMEFFGLNLGAVNNYAYLNKQNINIAAGQLGSVLRNENRNKANLFSEIDLGLPSGSFAYKKFGFGFFSRGRTMVSAARVPNELANFILTGFDLPEQYNQEFDGRSFNFKSLSWGEIGLGIAAIVRQEGDFIWSAGATAKLPFGISAFGANFQSVNYEVDSFNVQIDDFNGEYGFVTPQVLQRGWGLDLGFTVKKMKHNMSRHIPHSLWGNCDRFDYKYKFSFSVIDIGRIKFNQFATVNTFEGVDGSFVDYNNITINSFSGLDNLIKDRLGSNNFESSNELIARLPTAIFTQFDYSFKYNFYANASLMIGLPGGTFDVNRSTFFALTPRYEVSKFEFALPLFVHTFGNPRLGTMLRYRNFYIGSNNILHFVLPNIYGFSFYTGIRISLRDNKECRTFLGERDSFKWCSTPKKRGLFKRNEKDPRKSRQYF